MKQHCTGSYKDPIIHLPGGVNGRGRCEQCDKEMGLSRNGRMPPHDTIKKESAPSSVVSELIGNALTPSGKRPPVEKDEPDRQERVKLGELT